MKTGVAFYIGTWVGFAQGLAVANLKDSPFIAISLGIFGIIATLGFGYWDSKMKKTKFSNWLDRVNEKFQRGD